MKRVACVAAGMMVGLGLSASLLEAQVITGPEASRKAAAIPFELMLDSLGAGLDWMSWSQDEAVARMVYDPIKLLGLERFGPEGTMAIKGVVRGTEARIRSTVRALSAEEIDAAAATRSIEEALDEFRSAVSALLEAR
jgi:hypothetical protein